MRFLQPIPILLANADVYQFSIHYLGSCINTSCLKLHIIYDTNPFKLRNRYFVLQTIIFIFSGIYVSFFIYFSIVIDFYICGRYNCFTSKIASLVSYICLIEKSTSNLFFCFNAFVLKFFYQLNLQHWQILCKRAI